MSLRARHTALAVLLAAACTTQADPTAPLEREVRLPDSRPRGRVTFVIDDGRATDWTVKLPIFRSRGVVAVAAVPSEWRELTDEQLLSLQDVYGWEIANHGKRHRNETRINDDELDEELRESKAAFEGIGLRVNVHVYPFGASNQRVEDHVSQYFRAGVRAWGGVNAQPLRNPYAIRRTILDRTFRDSLKAETMLGQHGILTPYTAKWWRSQVRDIQKKRQWLIVSIHELTPEDIEVLEDLIDYTRRRKIPIVTLSQGLDMQ